jgi:rSAM/selenodomain-associated transferase 2
VNIAGQSTPEISIIAPVLNEADRINSFLRHLRLQTTGHNAEIIVVDGADDSSTIAAIADSDVVRLAAPKGRAKQMNAGAAAAKAPILLFLHADAMLGPEALNEISDVMRDQKYAAGAFEIEFDSESFLLRLIALRSNIRCRLSRIPYGDQGIFIRKDYFEHIGGYREIDFLEDIDLMRRIKRDREKICILKSKIRISSRRWDKEGILFCTIRNQIAVSLFHLGVHPNTLARFYKKVS